jgi:hypothetical protein
LPALDLVKASSPVCRPTAGLRPPPGAATLNPAKSSVVKPAFRPRPNLFRHFWLWATHPSGDSDQNRMKPRRPGAPASPANVHRWSAIARLPAIPPLLCGRPRAASRPPFMIAQSRK